MKRSLIVAMTEQRVIGLNGQLPWHIPEDLKRFKKITMGHPIIMGRKTLESIGRALPGRQNIVLTRKPESISIPHIQVASNFKEALNLCDSKASECFAIGGFSVYEEALPLTQQLYLTLVHKEYEGDTFFPKFNLHSDFHILEREEKSHPKDPQLTYSFITATRKS